MIIKFNQLQQKVQKDLQFSLQFIIFFFEKAKHCQGLKQITKMSQPNHKDIKQVLQQIRTEQQGKNILISSQIDQKHKLDDLSKFMVSQKIKKSSYFEDQYDDDDQPNLNSRQNTKLKQQQKTSITNKVTQVNQLGKRLHENQQRQQPYQKNQIYVSQPQEYQSVSSDRSQTEKEKQTVNVNKQQVREDKQVKYQKLQNDLKNDINLKSNTDEVQNKYRRQNNQKEQIQKKYTQNKDYRLKNWENTKNNELKHATFQIQTQSAYLSKQSKKSNQKNIKEQQALQKFESIYNSSNKSEERYKQMSLQINYPQVSKSHDKAQNIHKVEQDQMDFQASLNYLKSTKKYPILSKKAVSQREQMKRAQDYDQVLQIESAIQNPAKTQTRLTKYQCTNPKQAQSQQKAKNKAQSQQKAKNKAQSQQKAKNKESSLFYVSISGQDMYPSLDLKQKAKQKQLSSIKQEGPSTQSPEQKILKSANESSTVIKQKSNRNQNQSPEEIKIVSYRSQFFLKIQTQIFTLQVKMMNSDEQVGMEIYAGTKASLRGNKHQPQSQSQNCYQIQRRFSDFVFLYDAIMTNHLGYIIYPFPEKSLESFIKIKLQSLIGTTLSDGAGNTEAEKVQLIQKRIQQLQKFVNFLLIHKQLRHCEELGIFLCNDLDLYQKSKQRIQKYIQQYQQLQNGNSLVQEGRKNIKRALQNGLGKVMEWWGTPTAQDRKLQRPRVPKQMSSNVIAQQDVQFGQYSYTLSIYCSKYGALQRNLLKLVEKQQKFISFRDIDTEYDYLNKLCAKVSSCKQYNRSLIQMVEIQLIRDIETGGKWLGQTKMQLQKRQELKQLIYKLKETLSYTNDGSSKISKLERRLERFEKNFRFGFQQLLRQTEQIFQTSKQKFIKQWQKHCANMKKVWK